MAAKKDSTTPVERAERDVATAEQHLEAAQTEVVEAHRGRLETEQAAAEMGQAAVIEQQVEALRAAAEADPGRIGYTVGVWGGRPHYRSNDGRVDSFDEEVVRRYARDQMV